MYDHIPFGKVDEDKTKDHMKSFSVDLKKFALRKRCVACGMKNGNMKTKPIRSQSPKYWRFMRVSDDAFTELHFGHYSTILEPCLDKCILHLPALDLDHGMMRVCEPCDTHFTSKTKSFPAWILANNLTLIPLPENLADVRDSEIQLVTPRLRTHNIATIKSASIDRNIFLRSHVYVYGADPTCAIGTLPFDLLGNKAINISIVGPYTSDVKALLSTTYEIRPEKSLALLKLCIERGNVSILELSSHPSMKDILELATGKNISKPPNIKISIATLQMSTMIPVT